MTDEEYEKASDLEKILYDRTGMLAKNHPSIVEAMEEYAKLVIYHGVSHHVSGSYLPKCTRVEVIDNSGRAYTNYDCKSVETQMQDEERTLKVFIS